MRIASMVQSNLSNRPQTPSAGDIARLEQEVMGLVGMTSARPTSRQGLGSARSMRSSGSGMRSSRGALNQSGSASFLSVSNSKNAGATPRGPAITSSRPGTSSGPGTARYTPRSLAKSLLQKTGADDEWQLLEKITRFEYQEEGRQARQDDIAAKRKYKEELFGQIEKERQQAAAQKRQDAQDWTNTMDDLNNTWGAEDRWRAKKAADNMEAETAARNEQMTRLRDDRARARRQEEMDAAFAKDRCDFAQARENEEMARKFNEKRDWSLMAQREGVEQARRHGEDTIADQVQYTRTGMTRGGARAGGLGGRPSERSRQVRAACPPCFALRATATQR